MNKNVFIETSNLSGKDLKSFAKWLACYEAESEFNSFLEDNPDLFSDSIATEDIQKLSNFPPHKAIKAAPGQIRMLDKKFTENEEIITPILILSQWEDNQWLVVPFSCFNFPATTGEISTGMDFQAYQTVEAWNSIIVPEFFLYQNTVFLRDIPEEIRLEVCQLFFHLLADDELPQSVAEKIGPPIASQVDPRIQYLLEEKAQIIPAQEEAARLRSLFSQFSVSFGSASDSDDKIQMAAGETEEAVHFYAVSGTNALIRCFLQDDATYFKVFTSDKSDYSTELDNWSIVSETGEILCTIRDDKADLPGILQTFCVVSPEGNTASLTKVE